MTPRQPKPLRPSEVTARRRRIIRIARRVGRIEYRHVFGQAGGAQFGLAATEADDLLIVYAEAFDRDDLMAKATFDALGSGSEFERAIRLVSELRLLLEALL